MKLVSQSEFSNYGEAVEKYINMLLFMDRQPKEKKKNFKIKLITTRSKTTVNVFSKENNEDS